MSLSYSGSTKQPPWLSCLQATSSSVESNLIQSQLATPYSPTRVLIFPRDDRHRPRVHSAGDGMWIMMTCAFHALCKNKIKFNVINGLRHQSPKLSGNGVLDPGDIREWCALFGASYQPTIRTPDRPLYKGLDLSGTFWGGLGFVLWTSMREGTRPAYLVKKERCQRRRDSFCWRQYKTHEIDRIRSKKVYSWWFPCNDFSYREREIGYRLNRKRDIRAKLSTYRT